MPELQWLTQSFILIVLAILALAFFALIAFTIVIGILTKDLRWFLLAGLLFVVYFVFFVLRNDSFRETSFYQWLEQKPNQSLLPIFVAVVAVSVIVLILETGRRTKDIRWFLLASLLSVVYYLFIVLGTGFSKDWHSLPLLLGFGVYLGYLWFGGSSAPSSTETATSAQLTAKTPTNAPSTTETNPNRTNQSELYTSLIAPRRMIFAIFGLIIFVILLFMTSSYLKVWDLSAPSLGTRDFLRFAGETQDSSTRLLQAARSQIGSDDDYLKKVGALALFTESKARAIRSIARRSDSFEPTVHDDISTTITLTTKIISETQAMQWSGSASLNRSALESRATEVLEAAIQLEDTAVIVANIGKTPIPLMLLFLLFITLLLFPWVLFFAFIISKRAVIARDTRATLEDLGLIDRLVESTEGIGDEEQRVARQLVRDLDRITNRRKIDQAKQGKESGQANDRERKNEILAQIKTTRDHVMIPSGLQERFPAFDKLCKTAYPKDAQMEGENLLECDLLDLATIALHEAQETIIKQRLFYTREYILPLVILTILGAVGWYYVFFPQARVGLVNMVSVGTAAAFTKYLTTDISALTAAFIGGWLYVTTLLITRWTQDDLLPRSFFFAATRIVIAFVVGLLFASLVSSPDTFSPTFWQGATLLLAFAVGAAPYDFVEAVFRRIIRGIGNRFGDHTAETSLLGAISQEFDPPSWRSRQGLTTLEDVSIWDEARLQEEGIESVHALATADLEQLVIATPFPSQNLIDWVDQAILRVHATGMWYPVLAAAGLRTATDLLDRCYPTDSNDCKPDECANTKVVVRACLAADARRSAIWHASAHLIAASQDLTEKAQVARTTSIDVQPPDSLVQPVDGTPTANLAQSMVDLRKATDDLAQVLKLQDKEIQTAHAWARTKVTDLSNKLAETEILVKAAVDAAKTSPADSALKSKVEQAARATETLASETSVVAGQVQAAAPLLNEDILANILAAMNTDPNLVHVCNYWNNRRKRIVKSCGQTQRPDRDPKRNGSNRLARVVSERWSTDGVVRLTYASLRSKRRWRR